MTAIFGEEVKNVSIQHLEMRFTCGGDGIKPDSSVTTCTTCDGTGKTIDTDGADAIWCI